MTEDKVSCWVLERLGQEGTIRLAEGRLILGRLPLCDIQINSRFCSRRHCEFCVSSERITVSDFSTNGIFVNGNQFVKKEVELNNNDRVGIGVEATDEECVHDMDYFIFNLRKRPLTREDTSLSLSRGKSRDQNDSVAEMKDNSKVKCKTITDETRKENIVPIATCSKYEDELSKISLLVRKRVKARKSIDKGNADFTESLEDSLPLKIEPFSVPIDKKKELDEVFVISNEDEDVNNETLHPNKCVAPTVFESRNFTLLDIYKDEGDISPTTNFNDDEENNVQNKNNLDGDRNNVYQDKSRKEQQTKSTLEEKRKKFEMIDAPALPEKREKLRDD